MNNIQIKEVEISKDYLIGQHDNDLDYEDNFQLRTDLLKNVPTPKDCMVAFFNSFSPFLIKMIVFREVIAKKLGLKTEGNTTSSERRKLLDEFEGNIGDSIAIFEVLAKNEKELMTGQTDKHLDFKLSFISYLENDQKIVELATTVKFHGLLGKVYFFFVKPFHRFFMRGLLKRMSSKLVENEKQFIL
ncbi:MAG: DUF2867 domain-containing protein [Salibacteraceae bacterium]